MQHTISRLTATTLTIGMMALVSACAQGDPVRTVDPASIGNGSSLTRSDRRALRPAPTPALETVGAQTGPGFGTGVGAGVDTGIGLQPSVGLIP